MRGEEPGGFFDTSVCIRGGDCASRAQGEVESLRAEQSTPTGPGHVGAAAPPWDDCSSLDRDVYLSIYPRSHRMEELRPPLLHHLHEVLRRGCEAVL